MSHWLAHILECLERGWSPQGRYVAEALKELREEVNDLKRRVEKLERRSVNLISFKVISTPGDSFMSVNLQVVPVFADGTNVIDAAHQIPAGVSYPAGVHFSDVEAGELVVDPNDPTKAVFTPDDPNTAADEVDVTVDGFTGTIAPFTYQPPVEFTGFAIKSS